MEGLIKSVPGVESAKVDYDSGMATVVVKGPVTDEMLVEVVGTDAMCTAEVKQ